MLITSLKSLQSTFRSYTVAFFLVLSFLTAGRAQDTLPMLKDGESPRTLEQMWHGFDPRAEPLEVETLKEWEQDGVVLRVVRFRIGIFKGEKAMLAGVYGFPKGSSELPGLLQIHGGGQYADYAACLYNAKRGYATISIAWAGRISAPEYRVDPSVVQLYWDGKTDDPKYKVTTDWGAVDGYHAPSRNQGNAFPSARAAKWTIDEVDSPRNSGWFLAALAARRALTFLEQQPEVNPDLLGVYGHSMGGKLTVLTSIDPRVKAAAPSCGGISDRDNDNEIFRSTLGDNVSLQEISCPTIFLSPSNDFHGRIGDLPDAVEEIKSEHWRVTCSPHHNHQDTAEYEAATILWFDEHLKGTFEFPKTPTTELQLHSENGVPRFIVRPDASMPIASIDVFYTQQGSPNETPESRLDTIHRFWHHVAVDETNIGWVAELPIHDPEKHLWVYANVLYQLPSSVEAVGYYYRPLTSDKLNLSSVLTMVTPEELAASNVKPTLEGSSSIEDFAGDWDKEWFTYRPEEWALTTNKLHDDVYQAPKDGILAFEVATSEPNELVIVIDGHAAVVPLVGGDQWQNVTLEPSDFRNLADGSLVSWNDVRSLKLCANERLRPKRGEELQPRVVGQAWKGTKPEFRNLQWLGQNSPR